MNATYNDPSARKNNQQNARTYNNFNVPGLFYSSSVAFSFWKLNIVIFSPSFPFMALSGLALRGNHLFVTSYTTSSPPPPTPPPPPPLTPLTPPPPLLHLFVTSYTTTTSCTSSTPPLTHLLLLQLSVTSYITTSTHSPHQTKQSSPKNQTAQTFLTVEQTASALVSSKEN